MRWGPLFLAMQNQLVTTVTVTLQLTQNMGSSDGRSSISIIPDNDSKRRIFIQQLEMPEARTLSWLQIYYEFAD